MSTDDGSGWAPQLLNEKNSKIITRMINWAIGDPARNKDFSIRVRDTNLGESAWIDVYSKEIPKSEELVFSKLDENLYQATIDIKSPGFNEFFGAVMAVNTNSEFQKIGMNPSLSDIVTITGGKMFSASQTEELIEFVKSQSKRIETKTIYYRWPFVIAAIVLLLIEIFIRRLRENRNLYK